MQIPPDVLKQETDHDEQQPTHRILRRGRDRRLLREAVARFDAEPLGVVVPCLARCIDERRVTAIVIKRSYGMFTVIFTVNWFHPPLRSVQRAAEPVPAR